MRASLHDRPCDGAWVPSSWGRCVRGRWGCRGWPAARSRGARPGRASVSPKAQATTWRARR